MKKILTLSLLLFTINICFGQKTSLKLNLAQWSTYYIISKVKVVISETINGQQQDVNTTLTCKISYKVIAVSDSTYEMEVKYESMGMHTELKGQSMDFNSEKKDKEDIFSIVMSNMINKPFSVVLSKHGRILSINNIENLYSTIFDGTSQLTEAQKAQINNQLQQSFGLKAFKGNLEEAFAVYPDIKVAAGDKWVVNRDLESVFSAKIKTTYTLQNISDTAYLVHGDAVVQSGDNSDYKEIRGVPTRYSNINGNSIQDLKLDKVTGWLIEVKIDKMIKGVIDIKDNPKVPGGMKMPITVNYDMVITDK